jgi:hypothetical protein
MKLKLDLFDRATSEFSANIDYLNVCFVPKGNIQKIQKPKQMLLSIWGEFIILRSQSSFLHSPNHSGKNPANCPINYPDWQPTSGIGHVVIAY